MIQKYRSASNKISFRLFLASLCENFAPTYCKQNSQTTFVIHTSLAFLLIFFVALFLVAPVQAHILQTSGSIGAVLHIDPNDEPVANKPSYLFLEFKDQHNQFNQNNCDCQVVIYQGDKQIFSQPLFQSVSSDGNPNLTFTFPAKGDYKLKVFGKPLAEASFKPFSLEYAVDVDNQAGESSPTPAGSPSSGQQPSGWVKTHVVHLIGGVLVLGFFIYALIAQNKKTSKNI